MRSPVQVRGGLAAVQDPPDGSGPGAPVRFLFFSSEGLTGNNGV